MHSRAGEKSHDFLILCLKTENNDHAACLVFAEEASGNPSDHHKGLFFFVRLHMYACAVAGITFDEDFSTSHGISRGVADVAVNDYLALVHGIAYGVLGVCIDRNFGAVQVCAQSVAGNTFNCNVLIRHSRSDKALTAAAYNVAVAFGLPEAFIQCLVVKTFYIQ